MKYIFYILLASQSIFAQEENLSDAIASLKEQIANTEKGEKLILMDSLARLVEFNEDYNYSVLANDVITYGIEIDSVNVATEMAADQIFYKVNILNKPEEGLAFYNNYLSKVQNINQYIGSINLNLYAGDGFANLGKYTEAIEKFNESISISENLKNKPRIASGLYRLGIAEGALGNFAAASKNINASYTISEVLKDTLKMMDCKNGLSILYSQNQFYEEAAKERQDAIKLSTKNDGSLYGIYYNAAADAREQGDSKGWITNLEKSLAQSELSIYKDYMQPNIFNNLVIAYASEGNILKATDYLKKIEANPDKYASGPAADYYLEAKENLAFAKGEYKQALSIGLEHLKRKKEEESFVEIYNAENFLAKTYKELGEYNQANIHKNEYYRIKDSVSTAQKVKTLAYYQTLYETEKKDNTILTQEKDIAVLAEKGKARNQLFLFLGIIAVLGIVGFVLYKNYKQKLQRRLAVEQLRTKISADLHDDVGSLLTGLSMQSELLTKQVPEEQKYKLERISDISKDAMLKMRDAVWAMDARKDNWQSLADRMNEFASENLQLKDIAYTLAIDDIKLSKAMQGAVRQNLYLIFKEAIANVLKHSNATQVAVTLQKTKNTFVMRIADNGKFTNELSKAGQGLTNMTLRATQLLGNLQYENNNGFEIVVSIPSS